MWLDFYNGFQTYQQDFQMCLPGENSLFCLQLQREAEEGDMEIHIAAAFSTLNHGYVILGVLMPQIKSQKAVKYGSFKVIDQTWTFTSGLIFVWSVLSSFVCSSASSCSQDSLWPSGRRVHRFGGNLSMDWPMLESRDNRESGMYFFAHVVNNFNLLCFHLLCTSVLWPSNLIFNCLRNRLHEILRFRWPFYSYV